MSDRFGLSLSAGRTRISASFHGTMRLVDEHEVSAAPPRISGLDMLPGEFQTRIDITFDLLLKLGFVPVDPTHPARPLYLDALAAHDQAAQAEQDAQPLVPDSLAPHFIRVPFQTTFPITAEMSLRYGLVPPRRNAGATRDHTNGQAASRRDATPPLPSPPGPSASDLPLHLSSNPGPTLVGGKRDHQFPWMPAQKPFLPDRTGGGGSLSSADRDRLSVGPTANSLGPLPTDDFEAFLDFLGDPERRTPPATSDTSAPAHEAAQEALGPSDPSASTTRAAAAITTNAAPTAPNASKVEGIVAVDETATNAKARQPSDSARDATRLAETGLYHSQTTSYGSVMARFIQTDQIGYAGGRNLYAYTGGGSLNNVDPPDSPHIDVPVATKSTSINCTNSFQKSGQVRFRYSEVSGTSVLTTGNAVGSFETKNGYSGTFQTTFDGLFFGTKGVGIAYGSGFSKDLSTFSGSNYNLIATLGPYSISESYDVNSERLVGETDAASTLGLYQSV